jgi:hypothetical protein
LKGSNEAILWLSRIGTLSRISTIVTGESLKGGTF